MAKRSNRKAILALDVGAVRIGVAAASRQARIPRPVSIIAHDDNVYAVIKNLVAEEDAGMIVAGLPRNMDGLETKQSAEIREFIKELQNFVDLPIVFADESLSSVRASETAHGYRSTSAGKHLDDVAACLILEEFLSEIT